MYQYIISVIFTGIAALIFGLFVLSRSQNRLNTLYFFMAATFSIAAFSEAFLRVAPNVNVASLWVIMATMSWLLMASIFLHFSLVFSGRNVRYTAGIYLAGAIIFAFCVSSPDYIAGSKTGPLGLTLITGPVNILFSLSLAIYFTAGLQLILKVFRETVDYNKKRQAGYFIITGTILGVVEALRIFFGFPAVPLTFYAGGLVIGGMGYMIIRNTPVADIARGEIAEVATEALYDSLFLTDTAGIINYANEAGCRLSGYRADELLGKKLGDLVNPEQDRLTRKNGSMAVIKTDSFPVKQGKGNIYLVRDYTEIVNNLQEIEKNKHEIAALAQKENRVIIEVTRLLEIREVDQVEKWWEGVRGTDAAPLLRNAYDLNLQSIQLLEQAEAAKSELEDKVDVVNRLNIYFAGRDEELKKLEAELERISHG